MFGRANKGPPGHVVIVAPGENPVERETLQCVHCGMHWIYQPGSGRQRGWCYRCMGVTCGAKACNPCVPLEARIEIMEGAKTPMSRLYLDDYKKIISEP